MASQTHSQNIKEYKIDDKVVMDRDSIVGLHLSMNTEYTIVDISSSNDNCYVIKNNIGTHVTLHEAFFTMSPSYIRNKTIEDILS